jgi:hypothetical protein
LQPNLRLLGIVLQKDLTLLNLNFFLYFLYKNNSRHRADTHTSCGLGCVMPASLNLRGVVN